MAALNSPIPTMLESAIFFVISLSVALSLYSCHATEPVRSALEGNGQQRLQTLSEKSQNE